MAERTTYRRVPSDIAEASYIRDLIVADAKARVPDLAQAEKHEEIRTVLETKARWESIVESLQMDDDAPPTPTAAPRADTRKGGDKGSNKPADKTPA